MAAKVVRISKSGLTLNRPFNNPIRPDIESWLYMGYRQQRVETWSLKLMFNKKWLLFFGYNAIYFTCMITGFFRLSNLNKT
jgi:hypothetical protein